MATQSFLKEYRISSRRQAYKLAAALESKNPVAVTVSKAVKQISPTAIKAFFKDKVKDE